MLHIIFRYSFLLRSFFVCVLVLTSCRQEEGVSGSAASTNIDRRTIRYAQGFDIQHQDNFTLLHIYNRNEQTTDTISYLLMHTKDVIPKTYRNYTVIYTPVKRLITTSSTHVALINALDAYGAVVGHANADHIYNKKFMTYVQQQKITDVGSEMSINIEQTLVLRPDAFMAIASSNATDHSLDILQQAGVPIIYNADWQEETVLARAEWIKVLGALTEKEKEASDFFDKTALRYDSLRNLVATIALRPTVMVNAPYRETWHVAGGKSYMKKLIDDAGAMYYWHNNISTGGFVVPYEEAIEAGMACDFWINMGLHDNKNSLAGVDDITQKFNSFIKGNLYNYTQRRSEGGGNDYWEGGMVRPDLVLADLIRIFHPEVLPQHPLYFYKQLK